MTAHVINDTNFRDVIGDGHTVTVNGERRALGLVPRKSAYGSLPFARPYAAAQPFALVPREEWCDRFEHQEQHQSSLWHVWKRSPIGALDQDGFSWCHAFSATDAVMLARELQGLPYVELSATSVGGPVTGWHNAGAMIEQDLRQISEHGVSSTEFVPMLTLHQNECKPGWQENAKLHEATKWADLDPSHMLDQYVSALFKPLPVCVGLNWWGHAVTYLRCRPTDLKALGAAIKSGSTAAILNALQTDFLNSWSKKYGTDGVGTLAQTKQMPNEAYVPIAITPSDK